MCSKDCRCELQDLGQQPYKGEPYHKSHGRSVVWSSSGPCDRDRSLSRGRARLQGDLHWNCDNFPGLLFYYPAQPISYNNRNLTPIYSPLLRSSCSIRLLASILGVSVVSLSGTFGRYKVPNYGSGELSCEEECLMHDTMSGNAWSYLWSL